MHAFHFHFILLFLDGLVKVPREVEAVVLSLGRLLQFWYGLDQLPPQGLGTKLFLGFQDADLQGPLPSANTCSGRILVPRRREIAQYTCRDSTCISCFQEAFGLAILGSPFLEDYFLYFPHNEVIPPAHLLVGGWYAGFTPSVRLACRVPCVAPWLFDDIFSYVAQIHPIRG